MNILGALRSALDSLRRAYHIEVKRREMIDSLLRGFGQAGARWWESTDAMGDRLVDATTAPPSRDEKRQWN